MLERFYDLMVSCGIEEPLGREAWLKWASENSELWPIVKNGEMVGGVLFKGHTVHIVVRNDWQGRWITKSMLRAYPQWRPTCDVYAPIRKGNTKAVALAERLGFRLQNDAGLYLNYVKRKCDEPGNAQA